MPNLSAMVKNGFTALPIEKRLCQTLKEKMKLF